MGTLYMFRRQTYRLSLLLSFVLSLTACMGTPDESGTPSDGFTGKPPKDPVFPHGPPHYVMSSGGGFSSSGPVKMRARLGGVFKNGRAEAGDISVLQGMQREVHDFKLQ